MSLQSFLKREGHTCYASMVKNPRQFSFDLLDGRIQKMKKFPQCVLPLLFLLFSNGTSQPLLTKDELKQALKTEKELDLQGGLLPRKVKDRMARFFTDSAAANSAGGNLLDLGLDSDAIMTVNFHQLVQESCIFIFFLELTISKTQFFKSKQNCEFWFFGNLIVF